KEIENYKMIDAKEINEAKERLAFEITKMVHGEEEAIKALETAKSLFSNAGSKENMPTTIISDNDFTDGKIDILALLQISGLAPSRGEGRRLVQQGGININDEKIIDIAACYEKSIFEKDFIIKKGKKVFHRIIL
ncbi:MAG: tyrosine--tRNA ligase, partial [Oscillospiraceae bacterium]